ncbi:MAG: hypothetical protein WAM60_09640 [Candidatus Promineifilaceae bacterium]
MTQRSILAGNSPTVIIRVGGSVTVKGYDSDRVTAETEKMSGLRVEKRSESEVARARAAVGDFVLFDLRFKLPRFQEKSTDEDAVEVKMGGGGEVLVPFKSNVKVYAGKDIEVENVFGQVDAYSGGKLCIEGVHFLRYASAGRAMDLDCHALVEDNVEFKAGSNIRLHVQELTSAFIRVKDMGGYWEARIGSGDEKSIYLKCGGDVTLVTDQEVVPLPPNFILGNIEKPAE